MHVNTQYYTSLYVVVCLFFSQPGDRPQKSDSDLALKDSYPLLYSSKIKIYKYKDMEYNMQGFGAGGLPPLYFSHLSRNWKTSGQHARTLEDSTTARRELGVYVRKKKRVRGRERERRGGRPYTIIALYKYVILLVLTATLFYTYTVQVHISLVPFRLVNACA